MTHKKQLLAKVVSVCSAKDRDVWEIASNKIVQYIQAREYVLLVPDSDVELFKKISHSLYKVIPESKYVGNLKADIQKLLPPANYDRIGWYLQQFIKIAAAKDISIDGNKNDVVLIWDADTIPLKQLNFIDESGKVIYHQGVEQHPPYFEFIQKAFGLERQNHFSFIAQCFPAKISWIQEFCEQLESSSGMDWMRAILFYLDVSQRAGFSEYESLGTFIWSRHRGEVELSLDIWERNGRSLLGKPSQLNEIEWLGLSCIYDYISFEAWDQNRGWRAKWKSYNNRLKFRSIGRNYLSSRTSSS